LLLAITDKVAIHLPIFSNAAILSANFPTIQLAPAARRQASIAPIKSVRAFDFARAMSRAPAEHSLRLALLFRMGTRPLLKSGRQ
jgi:hypothetical protein